MDAGFFDVLHDAGDDDVFSVAKGVDVDFDRVFEEVIDEDGTLLGVFDGFLHVAGNAFAVEGDDHSAAAENVGGTHQHGIADAFRAGEGLFNAGGDDAGRLRDL